MDSLALRVVTTPQLDAAERNAIVDLCTRAFGFDFSSLFHYVQLVDHVMAYRDGVLVGHAIWSTRWLQPEGLAPLRTTYVDAVATDPTRWGQGIGSAVMRRLAAETADFDLGGLSTERPTFYERLGWERWLGLLGVRTENGIEPTTNETVLILRTPHTPPLDLRSLLTVEWRGGSPW
jgi:GNAT superfamily N-acetyltransferase